jgi:hypothetical protein
LRRVSIISILPGLAFEGWTPIGYKNKKFIARLTVTDNLKKFGKGLGSGDAEAGYAWYTGI